LRARSPVCHAVGRPRRRRWALVSDGSLSSEAARRRSGRSPSGLAGDDRDRGQRDLVPGGFAGIGELALGQERAGAGAAAGAVAVAVVLVAAVAVAVVGAPGAGLVGV
jgi:hypothetical protein